MNKQDIVQKWPFLASLVLHILLLGFLVVSFVPQSYRLPGPVDPKAVIQVRAVSQAVLDRYEAARKAKIAQARRVKLQRLARIKAARLAKRKALLIAKRKKRQREQRARAATQKKRLDQQHRRLARTLLSDQLAGEGKRLSQLRASQQQGIIDAYIPRILAAIGDKWTIPPGVSKRLSCVYQINLAPGGVVLGVKLLTSSGNQALDRSANQAIWRASPLPVPKNPALFDKFRSFRLTVRPEQYSTS